MSMYTVRVRKRLLKHALAALVFRDTVSQTDNDGFVEELGLPARLALVRCGGNVSSAQLSTD